MQFTIRHISPKLLLVAALILLTLFLFNARTAVAQGSLFSKTALGKMGDIEITSSQINALVAAQNPETRKVFASQPEMVKNLIEAELIRRSILNDALKADWDKRTDVAVAMERGRDQAIIDNYVMSRATPGIAYPSDAEIQAAYTANISRFQVPAQIRLAQILLRLPENASAAEVKRTLAQAQDFSQRLDRGENFEALAKEFSQDATNKDDGGLLNWVNESDLTPQIRTAIAGLKGNSVSKPIRSPFGYQLIKVVDRKASSTTSLGEAREAIVKALRDARTEQNRINFLEDYKKAKPLTINADALKEIRIKP
jgi:parvulin-like peptidyl-prolyl isomerase